MANQENPSKDSQRALPRNRRMRGVTHQPDSTPRGKFKSNEVKRAAERQAGQRDMFDDPIPEVEFRDDQPFLTKLLYFVDMAKNVLTTQRHQMVHRSGAA